MKILFIDDYSCAYNTTTYLTQPLGGTQSAVSHLAKALVQVGHEVAIINGIAVPTETDGVRFLGLPCPTPVLNEFDVIIPVSAPLGQTLKGLGCVKPIVLWSHHAANQQAVQALCDPNEWSVYVGIALISDWQAQNYETAFGISRSRTKIMRNAVSPAFLNTKPAMHWLKTGAPPVLAYSSTPYRGLDVLLLAFASIRKQLPGATLRIFSSMKIYGPNAEDDYAAFYEMAHSLPGVVYEGPLPQPRLAEEMAKVDIWTYPCTFEETSCISAMEAMASGNLLISTDLGALSETTAGFAHLLAIDGPQTSGKRATQFANYVASTAFTSLSEKENSLSLRAKQIEFVHQNYTWEKRAAEWTEWLNQILFKRCAA